MYKVFLNDRKIVIGSPEKITNKNGVYFETLPVSNEVRELMQSFIKSEKDLILLSDNENELIKSIQNVFKVIPAAGGVVRKKKKLLFILRRGKWDLPKGKIDATETPKQAALREVEEECGIKGHEIIKTLPSTYHIYKSEYKQSAGEWIFKQTYWFEMEYNGMDLGTPEKNEGITELKWLYPHRLNEVLSNTYENLKQIIKLYFD